MSKKEKKKKFKRIYWLLIDLVILVILFILLTHKPAHYSPFSAESSETQEHDYLRDELIVQLNDGAKTGDAFEVVITQDGLNEIIFKTEWLANSQAGETSSPCVFFETDRIVLMLETALKGANFIVSIAVKPEINEQGLMCLEMVQMKVGALDMVFLARTIAKRMYNQKVSQGQYDSENLQNLAVASLFNDEPFDPIFEFEGRKFRTEQMFIEPQELTVLLRKVSK